MGTLKRIIVAVTVMGMFGCGKEPCETRRLFIQQASTVMAKPYPQWYTRRVNNTILATIDAGQSVPICRFITTKEFAIYQVKLPDGRVGFIEFDSAKVREVAATKADLPTR